jgi:hypothetical protein
MRQLTYTAFKSAHNDSVAYQAARPAYESFAALNPVPPLLMIFGAEDRLVPVDTAKLFEKVTVARSPMSTPS